MSMNPPSPSLSDIRELAHIEDAKHLVEQVIPSEQRLSDDVWSRYSPKYVLLGLKACLAIYVASDGKIVPREFQMKATLSLLAGDDSLVDVGTGYGKTFCMILPSLLFPHEISLVISPLKHLQALQLLEFEKYHIAAVSINEDTPKDAALWKVSI
ncbi:hypothetical protein BDQ17DRAFT_1249526 [Cyathus striatus]|nr:hypothetical protein BDQ17DRAFT_1249526 [Cyathus striatus]